MGTNARPAAQPSGTSPRHAWLRALYLAAALLFSVLAGWLLHDGVSAIRGPVDGLVLKVIR